MMADTLIVASALDIATHKCHPQRKISIGLPQKEPTIGATMTLSHKTPTGGNSSRSSRPVALGVSQLLRIGGTVNRASLQPVGSAM
ncbi:hypothetical protein MPLDJ20_220074 [Mesorhizobium plurifarium]|uniref:Uncharacterized protein n=1 Tax=Mesorhizobium plurifarium TaxID=69974 RepID=A0A090F8Y6_MESPL|nr:hypothetical protein MPLDJ20_220074 [Mesorhizobium plurifarium]